MDLEKQKLELQHCGIEYIGETSPERASGKLGEFLFQWSGRGYWIVTGKMPLKQAWRLHRHPAGNTIRVDGHCMCPAPVDPHVSYYTHNGKKVWTLADKAEAEENIARGNILAGVSKTLLETCHFDDDRSPYAAYIELYHIDSELGLYVFAEMVRELLIRPQIDINVELLKLDRVLRKMCERFDIPYPPKEASDG